MDHPGLFLFNIEIIIIDDCSTDGTSEILSTISNVNIKIINHEINKIVRPAS